MPASIYNVIITIYTGLEKTTLNVNIYIIIYPERDLCFIYDENILEMCVENGRTILYVVIHVMTEHP